MPTGTQGWRGVCTRRLVRRYRDSEQIYDRLIAIKPDKFYKVELTHLIVISTLLPSPSETLSGFTGLMMLASMCWALRGSWVCHTPKESSEALGATTNLNRPGCHQEKS
jgi:hypothetical protein